MEAILHRVARQQRPLENTYFQLGNEAIGRRTVRSKVEDIHNIHYFLHLLASEARWFTWVGIQDAIRGY
jgi:hypothetical protein